MPHPRQLFNDPVHRVARRFLLGLILSFRVLMKERPDGMVVVGSAIAVPLFLAARFAGVKTVFIDSITRVTRPSTTGRILSMLGLASRFYVQWPEAVRMYRRAICVGQLT